MFDIGWSELLLIGVVAIIVVGPRDLPRLMRTVGQYVQKMRRMARDLQSQFDAAIREAELDDVKKSMTDLGRINPARDIREAVTKPITSVADDLKKTAGEVERTAAAKPAAKPAAAPEAANGGGEGIAEGAGEAAAAGGTEPAVAAGADVKRAAAGGTEPAVAAGADVKRAAAGS